MFDTGMATTIEDFWNNVYNGFVHNMATTTYDTILNHPLILPTAVSVFFIELGLTIVVGVLFLHIRRNVR